VFGKNLGIKNVISGDKTNAVDFGLVNQISMGFPQRRIADCQKSTIE
jgi:hypothetical protein